MGVRYPFQEALLSSFVRNRSYGYNGSKEKAITEAVQEGVVDLSDIEEVELGGVE